jgi:hypothetical protein
MSCQLGVVAPQEAREIVRQLLAMLRQKRRGVPQPGQRWRKRGAPTVEVEVTYFHDEQVGPFSLGPLVRIESDLGARLCTLDEFRAEYEGPLPDAPAHEDRVEYVPLVDPPGEYGRDGEHRLSVRVEGRGASRVVTIDEEDCHVGDRWHRYGSDARLRLAPSEARLLLSALAKVLHWKEEETQ